MSAIPEANQLPAAPRSISAKVIKSSLVSIGWLDSSSSETGFSIERSTDGVNFTQVRTMGANATGASDLPPAPGLYYYQVRAFNAAGTSEAAEITAVLY
jgi:titin